MLYRVKSPPPPLCRRSHRLIKRQNNGGERRNSITAFPREKKKRESLKTLGHSRFCLIMPPIRKQSIFRFSTTARHPFVVENLIEKPRNPRETFLPFRPSAFSSIDKEIENAIAKFFFPCATLSMRKIIGFRTRLEILSSVDRNGIMFWSIEY